ncbi:SMI1/KNR4 family protein [Streptomyces olivaceiscleroticus]|uniref:SMI1/KNR4 family protein n=1 Tax=Streptomyces olivaceiscleroticus TaxID=68245 RepID=UPI0031F846DA
MWPELIARWADDLEVQEPAQEADLKRAEESLGEPLPPGLRRLLAEFNGLADCYGTDLIWPADQMAETNAEFRESLSFAKLYGPFGDLVFFGDNGGGDQFALRRGDVDGPIVVWDHETDSRTVVAESLQEYLVRALESDGEGWYR